MRMFPLILKAGFVMLILGVIVATVGYFYFSSNLPELNKLSAYQPPLVSRIYNTDGELVAEFADEHRILTPFEDIPEQLRNAFLAAEDQQFYEHPGINPARILSAALANLKAGHAVQGGSTITQQVAKNFLLTSEKKLSRKIREAILSYRIEQSFTKDEILYLYLNHIYLGRGAYGVASAAWRYFGKRLDELTLSECAMLAGLPKAPGRYAPHLNPDLAKKRRNTILYLMDRSGFAKPDDVKRALEEELSVAPLQQNSLTDAYGNEVHNQLVQKFGLNTLRKQGMTIIIPYSAKAEEEAVHAVRKGLLEVEQRQLYRIPVHHQPETWAELLDKWAKERPEQEGSDQEVSDQGEKTLADDQTLRALVEKVLPNDDLMVNDGREQWLISHPDWKWEPLPETLPKDFKKRPLTWVAGDEVLLQGDGKGGVRLTQQPSIESALYSVDMNHGTVLARVGGFDYRFGDFDRVSQAVRQPGSSFKPLLYATALEQGFTPATIIMDTPVVFDSNSSDNFWRPENYKNKFVGPVTLRDALEHSRNLASIKLLQNIGIDIFTNKLRDFPFSHDFPRQLALSLGATEAPLEELTEAYIPLASGGKKWKPVSIQQVQDRTGKSLHRSVAGHRCQVCHVNPVLSVGEGMRPAEQILDTDNSFLITNMLKGVIDRGTGIRARALGRPAAGKTGTTNNQVDAWFIGFTPQILTGVWTGRDSPAPMGRYETGSHAALPTWLTFMQDAHRGKEIESFTPPKGIEWALIDRKTGKLANADTESTLLEAFKEGTAPVKEAPADTKTDNNRDFFDSGI
ncbi:MAG TPA: PBP1A family penicillin-binding protein [Mariprofundaceae bacterium]|nr:PBP1A family penicillin-binding protein [Mariprofundaceae bacterium]